MYNFGRKLCSVSIHVNTIDDQISHIANKSQITLTFTTLLKTVIYEILIIL